jgi:zinc transport system ATP-binding protein
VSGVPAARAESAADARDVRAQDAVAARAQEVDRNVLALDLRGVSYTWPGASAPAVDRVTLRVPAGARLGVLGPNGGGKTTLLKLILGEISPQGGSVRIFGLAPAEARRRGLIGSVPQRSDAVLEFPLTARQVVELGAGWRRAPWRRLGAEVRARVDQSLELTGATSLAGHRIGALSGGQRQRVFIARAIAAGARLLLLDEPTVGVDVVGQQQFAELISRVRDTLGATVVLVSHDLRAVAAGCDQIGCINRTLHSHTAPEGLSPQILAEVFQHEVAGAFGDFHVHAHAAEECPMPGDAPARGVAHHEHGHEHGEDRGQGHGEGERGAGGRA